jgi:hypothetical protein
MTSGGLVTNDERLWNDALRAYDHWISLRAQLFHHCGDRVVSMIAQGLRAVDPERTFALELVSSLPLDGKEKVFPEILQLGIAVSGVTARAAELVKSMPRDWLQRNLVRVGKELLVTAEEVYGLVTLCGDIDRPLAIEVARTAAANDRADVREAGERCLLRFRA